MGMKNSEKWKVSPRRAMSIVRKEYPHMSLEKRRLVAKVITKKKRKRKR